MLLVQLAGRKRWASETSDASVSVHNGEGPPPAVDLCDGLMAATAGEVVVERIECSTSTSATAAAAWRDTKDCLNLFPGSPKTTFPGWGPTPIPHHSSKKRTYFPPPQPRAPSPRRPPGADKLTAAGHACPRLSTRLGDPWTDVRVHCRIEGIDRAYSCTVALHWMGNGATRHCYGIQDDPALSVLQGVCVKFAPRPKRRRARGSSMCAGTVRALPWGAFFQTCTGSVTSRSLLQTEMVLRSRGWRCNGAR